MKNININFDSEKNVFVLRFSNPSAFFGLGSFTEVLLSEYDLSELKSKVNSIGSIIRGFADDEAFEFSDGGELNDKSGGEVESDAADKVVDQYKGYNIYDKGEKSKYYYRYYMRDKVLSKPYTRGAIVANGHTIEETISDFENNVNINPKFARGGTAAEKIDYDLIVKKIKSNWGEGQTFTTKELASFLGLNTSQAYNILVELDKRDLMYKYGYKTKYGWESFEGSSLKPNSLSWQVPNVFNH